MPQSIGAEGFIGIAFETTAGTYVAPTKFFPFMKEDLMFNQEFSERRVIRQIVDSAGTVLGNGTVEGSIEMEVLTDVLPYFLYAGRYDVVKSGAGPYVYTCVGAHRANSATGRTLSITVIRNGVAFGYTGCIISSLEFSTGDGVFTVKADIIGENEADQTVPTPTFASEVPFGMGSYQINYGGGVVTDTGDLTITINDNGQAVHRLDTDTGAEFVHWGERNASFSATRDFIDRADYNAFRAATQRALTVTVGSGNNIVEFSMPKTTMQTYEIGLEGQGDLVQAEVEANAEYDATLTSSVSVTVTTPTENIT